MGMSSTFMGLNTAYLGLLAANASLNTTANNISNVETEGYSRQHTVQQAAKAIQTFTAYGSAGAGVDVLAIERYRNEFYDTKYWNNNANVGEYDKKQYYMKQIEDYFIDDDTQEGFSTIFNKMYDTLADLKKDSGTAEVRSAFISAASNLTEYFTANTANLQKLQLDVNEEIKICIDRINSLAQELVTLNKQINVVEIGGGIANELRDQRAVLIDELSEYVDVKTMEYDVLDGNNENATGATRFIVQIAGGQTLVDGSNYETLTCKAREDQQKVNQMDADGLYDILWSNGNTFSLTNKSMGGNLRGLIDMRDGNNGEYFHGVAADSGSVTDADGNTFTTVSITVTQEYLQDFNKTTLPENGKLQIGSAIVDYTEFSFEFVSDGNGGGSYQYTFTLSDNSDVTKLIGKNAKVGYSVNYQGIPYYLSQMTEWVRDYAQAFNKIETMEGAIDNYGNPAENFFLADNITDPTQYTFSDMTGELYGKINGGESYSISSKDDTYYKLTSATFAVAERCVKDNGTLATHTGNVDEQSKYDVVDQMIKLKSNLDLMNFRGCSSDKFLQCILADISLNANRANTFHSNYENIASSIQNQRLSVSGVDSDEEGVNLVKYQNAYSLASKMIQTLTEIYDRLILETGV